MDARAKELVSQGDALFSSRNSLMSYWQEVAENFYPERADFTTTREAGDYSTDLMSSEPVLIRRELANLIQSMLRPDGSPWFEAHVTDESSDQNVTARKWLEWISTVQRRAMYHAPAQFVRATKEADQDWVTFGMAVLEIDVYRDQPSLLYRCGHIRDHAWSENFAGAIDTVHRRWRPTARQLVQMFPDKVDAKVKEAAQKEPEKAMLCRRLIVPRDSYDMPKSRSPGDWVSIYIDCENETVLEEYPLRWNPFVIPRWQTVSGSQYAWSPCTGPGLADARTLQSLVRLLLEAGEKAVDPPMIAKHDVVRSDYAIYAGGVTVVDAEYDERTGEALRVLDQDRSGMPIGLEMADRLRGVLTEGFFLNKITLPQDQGKMTAYEVRKRLEEHIRSSAPILAPAEQEYNAAVCDRTFEVLRTMKAFGPAEDIPQALRGQEIRYEFRSPIRDLEAEMKGQKLLEALNILGPVAQIDPAQMKQIDFDTATSDALMGIKVPAKWLAGPKAVAAERGKMQKMQEMQAGLAAVQSGGAAAEQAGKGMQAIQQAMPR